MSSIPIMSLLLTALPDIPHIQPDDDIAEVILAALATAGFTLQNSDILVIAQKIISKAEGRSVNLADVTAGERAREVAAQTGKDPRLVELILQESDEISRLREGVLIVRHRLGFTSANAGIDRSNVSQPSGEERVLLLPLDPDGSAAGIRAVLEARSGVQVGVIVSDTHGRPFRQGNVGVAIGVAGLPALWDRRGDFDLYGYELQHTTIAVADEIAAAAGLLMGQASEGLPVVLVRGLQLPPVEGKAQDLVRPKEMDLYR